MSKNLDGWTAHTGVEFQTAPFSVPGVWVGLDYRFAHQSGKINDDPVSGDLHFFSATLSYQFSVGH
jgi:hypothetical protein